MTDPHAECDPLDTIATEFSERLRKGEDPSVSEYIKKYPGLADELRQILPTIRQLEGVKTQPQRASGGIASFAQLHVQQLGDFRLLREIGRGGMGIVYEAEQESLGRRVAIKVLPRLPWQDARQREQFKREAQVAAGLHHTNIVQVHGVGEDEGFHYYAMQMVSGIGLDRVIAWLAKSPSERAAEDSAETDAICRRLFGGPCDPTNLTNSYWHGVARIGEQVAHALAYAHSQGVIHRDIKPGNLLIDQQGVVWITDFGLARADHISYVTQPGNVAGTLRYMAPERFSGDADAPSDIYALGITLYELLTWRSAFDAPDPSGLIRQITRTDPVPPRRIRPYVPRDLETIVLKTMAREPHRRYTNAAELAADLHCYLDGRPIQARKTSVAERLWLWGRRNPVAAVLASTTLSLLLLAAAIGWVGYARTQGSLRRESLQLEKTQSEHQRAEANLELALRAFDEVFNQMTFGPAAGPADPEAGVTYEFALSAKDAAILQNLLTFYDRFAEHNRDRPGLHRQIAHAYYRVGQIQNKLGQFEKAQTACNKALDLCGDSATTAEDADHLRLRAGAYHELGLANLMMGQHRTARDAYRYALDTLNRLSATSSMSEAVQFAIAQSYEELGSIPSGQGGPDEFVDRQEVVANPEASTRRALEILVDLVAQSPENPVYQNALARTHRNLAMSYFREGQELEAEQALDKTIELLTNLIDRYPTTPTYLYDLIAAYTLEHSPKGQGQKRQVPQVWQQRYLLALELAERLNQMRPDVPAYLGALGRTHLKVAEVWLSRGERDQAEHHLAQAVTDLDTLMAQGLYASTYLCDYLQATQALSRLLIARGQWRQARDVLEKHLETIEHTVASGSRRRREWALLARQYEDLANVCFRLGDHSGAAEANRRVRQIQRDQGLEPDHRPRPPLRDDTP